MIRKAFMILGACAALAAPALAKDNVKITKQMKAAGEGSTLEQFLPPPVTPDNTWNLDLSDGGRVTIQLRPDVAPKTVERIKTLTGQGFYNGLMFHRVIDGFMAQGGDPKGTGEGGSTLPDLQAEFNDLPHVRGSVAAARAADDNSANSQFYIMFQPNLKLDHHYTVFGRVIGGMPYVDAIQRGEPPQNPTRIVRASIGDVPPMAASALMPTPGAMAPAALPSGTLDGAAPAPRPKKRK